MRTWTEALDGHRPPSFEPAGHRRVTVVAAHPDDETLGASGCLQALHRAGAEVTLVVATDGEAAYPALDADARRDLARARRVELAAALRAQGLGDVAVHWLGLPDSGLASIINAMCSGSQRLQGAVNAMPLGQCPVLSKVRSKLQQMLAAIHAGNHQAVFHWSWVMATPG